MKRDLFWVGLAWISVAVWSFVTRSLVSVLLCSRFRVLWRSGVAVLRSVRYGWCDIVVGAVLRSVRYCGRCGRCGIVVGVAALRSCGGAKLRRCGVAAVLRSCGGVAELRWCCGVAAVLRYCGVVFFFLCVRMCMWFFLCVWFFSCVWFFFLCWFFLVLVCVCVWFFLVLFFSCYS
jgi:hypothetical protein